ncbi:hypothetical protein JCM6882_006045 [Rhodosporidiobolus microsporus]
MAHRLLTGDDGFSGAVLGPSSDPTRYRLVRRLNGKEHATLGNRSPPEVWMAVESSTNRSVVVKIVRLCMDTLNGPLQGVATHLSHANGFEKPVQRGVPQPVLKRHPGQTHCVSILDSFGLPWEEGREPVLDEESEDYDTEDGAVVLEELGPSLALWQKERTSPLFPLSLVRRIIQQVLLAVDNLHSWSQRPSTAHLGISLDNVLFAQHYTPQDLRADKPSTQLHVKLVGFTTSIWDYGDEGTNWYAPSDWDLSSPELMLTGACYGDFGPPRATDIWQLGLITSFLLFNKDLTLPGLAARDQVYSPVTHDHAVDHFPLSREAVLSLASLDRDAGWPKFFDETNLFEHNPNYPFNLPGVVPLPSLRERIEAEGVLSDSREVDLVTSFLGACWTLDPYKRASAKELLEGEFIKGVEKEG